MKAVILDAETLGSGINLSAIEKLVDDLVLYDSTTPKQVNERVQDADIVITNKVVINKQTIEIAEQLKLICVLATGMNNIDLAAAEKADVKVKNVEAYGTASVVQHTLMMMLALATKLPVMQKRVAAGDWQDSSMFCLLTPSTIQLAGKKLVIVGSGELGQAVKTLAEALGMSVEFSARPGKKDDPRPTLNDLLPDADVVSFHCPLTDDTKNLLNADNLKLCKKDALIVNNARGGVINEPEVTDALRAGNLGGVATDVLPQEPPKDGNVILDAMNEGLNLIVTPHNAWTTPEARQRIVELTVENIQSILEKN